MKETNREINPMIHAAVAVLRRVEGVDEVEILSEMYRTPAETNVGEEYVIKMGVLGVDIRINHVKTFLPYERCEDLIMYPTGPFIAVDFVHEILRAAPPSANPPTFLKEPE